MTLLRHFAVDPAVRFFHPVAQRNRRRPTELALDQRVIAIAAADALRRIELVPALELDARDLLHDVDESIDRHQLVASQIERVGDVACHDRVRAKEAIVDVHEAARLFAVAPDLDLAGSIELRPDDLAANSRRRLLPTAVIGAKGAVDVVIARHARLQAEVFSEVAAHPLAEELLPAIAVLRHRRVRVLFLERDYVGTRLLFRSVDTAR